MTIHTQIDHFFTFRAASWFEFWRVLQFFKVVFICPIIDIHLCLKITPAFLAGLPITRMPFVEMVAAQCVAIMVSGATVAGVRKQDILMLVIANPIAAALGFGQVFGFAA